MRGRIAVSAFPISRPRRRNCRIRLHGRRGIVVSSFTNSRDRGRRIRRNSTAGPVTQFRSNPVSSRGLPKTGIFQRTAGDFRQFQTAIRQIGGPETDLRIAKARHWRAFLPLSLGNSHPTPLPGWRSSRIRTRLQMEFPAKGRFTGKFPRNGGFRRILVVSRAAVSMRYDAIPYSW